VAFARLNGVVVDVAADEGDRRLESIGKIERSLAGNAVDTRRQARRSYRLRLISLPYEEARSLALLAIGHLHVFSFNGGLEASTSLGPSAAVGHAAHLSPGDGWDGDAMVVRSAGAIAFAAQLDGEWTIIMRFRDALEPGAPWRVCARTDDGREWLDGVEGSFGVPNVVTVNAGSVVVYGRDLSAGNADLVVDELIVAPFRLADAHILDALAWEQPWGPSPEVHLQGDVIEAPLGVFVSGATARADVRGRGGPLGPSPTFAVDESFITNAVNEELELIETWRPASLDALPLPLLYFPQGAAFTADPFVVERIGGLDLQDLGGVLGFAAGPDGRPDAATVYAGGAFDRAERTGTEGSTLVTGELSGCGWFRPAALAAQPLFSKWRETSSGREWRVLMLATGQVVVEVSNGSGTDRETYTSHEQILAAGQWSFVAFDYAQAKSAGARVRLFADGRPRPLSMVPTGAFSQMNTSTGRLNMPGQSDPALGFDGQVAQCAVWSSALTTSQHRIAYLLTRRGHPLRRA